MGTLRLRLFIASGFFIVGKRGFGSEVSLDQDAAREFYF